MNWSRVLIASVLASGLLTAPLPADQPPNVLLICIDDLKPALGCYGDKLAQTPHLDRLAARAMRFELAYCNQAVCAPSRNSLLLGSRPTSCGVYTLGEHFRRGEPHAVTLPQHFIRYGYRAESVGKVLHTGHGNRDDEASWSVPAWKDKVVEYLDPQNSAGGKLTREEALFSNQPAQGLPRGAAWESRDVPDDAYADGRIATEALRRLKAAQERLATDKTPFFLAVGFVKPHLPLTAPEKYWRLHKPADFPLAGETEPPRGAPPYAGKQGGEIVQYEPLSNASLREAATQRTLIHGYYACVSYVDAQIGRVLDELTRLGLAETTIVVVWGDHGWHLGDHGYWTKHTNYEEANRIPLLIAAPGVTHPGRTTRQLAETVDLFPTLAELAGLPPPQGPQAIDGVSLAPVLRDPSRRVRDHASHCYPRGMRLGRAIRTERYRLVEWKVPGAPPETAELELYDYEQAPQEPRNLAREQPEVVRKLRAILAKQPEAKWPK